MQFLNTCLYYPYVVDYVKVEDSSHVKILLYLFATFALIIVTAVVSFNCRHRLECICREDENFKDIFT